MTIDNRKITIITVVYNGEFTIEDTIRSVLSQTYSHIEYIVVDGASKDGTLAITEKYRNRISKIISGPDRGLYDAMNKGIVLATGDIIGFLHSDDVYPDNNVISTVADVFNKTDVDSVFGDLVYVDRYNSEHIIRYYRANDFSLDQFALGLMPPHPTFFLKRNFYEKYGLFKTDYQIAADFELLARFLSKYKATFNYIPQTLVKMRQGGISTRNFKSNYILNREILRACAENDIRTNIFKIYKKYFIKILQLIDRPS